jgi:hypothetical protein
MCLVQGQLQMFLKVRSIREPRCRIVTGKDIHGPQALRNQAHQFRGKERLLAEQREAALPVYGDYLASGGGHDTCAARAVIQHRHLSDNAAFPDALQEGISNPDLDGARHDNEHVGARFPRLKEGFTGIS